jgi:hypothetical protein
LNKRLTARHFLGVNEKCRKVHGAGKFRKDIPLSQEGNGHGLQSKLTFFFFF